MSCAAPQNSKVSMSTTIQPAGQVSIQPVTPAPAPPAPAPSMTGKHVLLVLGGVAVGALGCMLINAARRDRPSPSSPFGYPLRGNPSRPPVEGYVDRALLELAPYEERRVGPAQVARIPGQPPRYKVRWWGLENEPEGADNVTRAEARRLVERAYEKAPMHFPPMLEHMRRS
jgi:hypothetical protein